MAFLPTPMSLRMTRVFKRVDPAPICWDRPDYMYLVGSVRGADNKGVPSPTPFDVTGQHQDSTRSYATLSIKTDERPLWEEQFRNGRELILTLNVNGTDRDLLLRLTYS